MERFKERKFLLTVISIMRALILYLMIGILVFMVKDEEVDPVFTFLYSLYSLSDGKGVHGEAETPVGPPSRHMVVLGRRDYSQGVWRWSLVLWTWTFLVSSGVNCLCRLHEVVF